MIILFCRDIDIAYMILPVIICLYYLLESAFVVAYLDTVYFGVTQWQEILYRLDSKFVYYLLFIFYPCQVVANWELPDNNDTAISHHLLLLLQLLLAHSQLQTASVQLRPIDILAAENLEVFVLLRTM